MPADPAKDPAQQAAVLLTSSLGFAKLIRIKIDQHHRSKGDHSEVSHENANSGKDPECL